MIKRIASILTLILLTTGFVNAQQPDPNAAMHQAGAPLPTMKIVTPENQTFVNKNLKTKGHLFVVYYNPTCGHCITFAKVVKDNLDLLKDSKIVFMSTPNTLSYIGDFLKQTELQQSTNVIIGVDKAMATDKLGVYAMFPLVFVYDSHQKLVTYFKGDTPKLFEALRAYMP